MKYKTSEDKGKAISGRQSKVKDHCQIQGKMRQKRSE